MVVSLALTREEVVLLAKDHKEEVEGGGDKVTFQVTIEGKTAEETASKFNSILKASKVPIKDTHETKMTKKEKFDGPEVKVMESSEGKNLGSLESSVKKSCLDDIKVKKPKTELKFVDRGEVDERKVWCDGSKGKRKRTSSAESVETLEEKILKEHLPLQDKRKDVGKEKEAGARHGRDRKRCRSRSRSASLRKYAKEGHDYEQALLWLTTGGPGPGYEAVRAKDGRFTVSVAACGHMALGTDMQEAQAVQAAARNLLDKLQHTKMEVEKHRGKGKSKEECTKSSSPPRKGRERRSSVWCWHRESCRNRNCKFQHGEDFDFTLRIKEQGGSREERPEARVCYKCHRPGHFGADCRAAR